MNIVFTHSAVRSIQLEGLIDRLSITVLVIRSLR